MKRAQEVDRRPDQDRPRDAAGHGRHARRGSASATSHALLADADVVIEAITEDEAAKTATYRRTGEGPARRTRSWPATPRRSRSRGWPSRPPTRRGSSACTSSTRSTGWSWSRSSAGEKTSDETVATIVALAKRHPQDADRGPRLPGLPGQPRAVALHERGADPAGRGGRRWTRSTRRPPGSACRWGRSPSRTSSAWTRPATPARCWPTPTPIGPSPTRMLGGHARGGAARARSRGRGSASTAARAKPAPDPAVAAILEKHRTGGRTPGDEEITDRLFLPMLLEATRVLEEGIVREPADVDMGLILGIGFPPFRGGILRWCDSEGAGSIVERADALRPARASGYEPTETLIRQAQTGEKFYPAPRSPGPPPRARRAETILLETERTNHETRRRHRRRADPDRAGLGGQGILSRRPLRGPLGARHPRARRADGDRPAPDRGRALGMRPAAGGAGVRHRPRSPRSSPACRSRWAG